MTSLADFLLAQIADDEAAARAASDQPPRGYPDGYTREHVARWDPARVLAECESKRRIVELHAITRTMVDMRGFDQPDYREPEDSCEVCGWVETDSGCDTLRALATPYADRPGFEEAWR